MYAPVIVHIRPGKSIFLGSIFAVNALFFIAISAPMLVFGVPLDWLIGTALVAGVCFGAGAAFFFGIAIRKPVALRMDAHGISGFYTDPALWEEIAEIDLVKGQKGHRFLGFKLHDPVAFRDRQSPWRRFNAWSNGRSTGYHLTVPEVLMRDTTVNELLPRARALHSAALAHDEVT